MDKKLVLKNKMLRCDNNIIKSDLKIHLDKIEDDICKKVAIKNKNTIEEHVIKMSSTDGAFNATKMWKLKRKFDNFKRGLTQV